MQVDQPNCKEAMEMDPEVGHRCWHCSYCFHHCHRVAPNRASIEINYLRYYYNYLFLYWDYDLAGSEVVQCCYWKPDVVDGNYCYCYYCC